MKEPRKYTYCENCDRPYGFINCPVVKRGGIWWCLKCCVEEERDKLNRREGDNKNVGTRTHP